MEDLINENKEVIKDKKLLYLARTLSRTNRKNYENFVINAIWNKLGRDDIEIVSQQYIPDPDDSDKYYMIDLYFPALNIGIECDEEQHRKTKAKDDARDEAIYNTLYQYNKKGYKPIRIDITGLYEEVMKEINDAVDEIKEKIKELEKTNLPEWVLDAEKYYNKKDVISIDDKVGFNTVYEACNIIISTDYNGMQKSCFTPEKFKNNAEIVWEKNYNGYELWFPHLAIRDKDDNLISPTEAGWLNVLVNNGKEIIEENPKRGAKSGDNVKPKITFAKYKDPLGNQGYKFIGIFKPEKELDGEGKRHYNRIGTECKIIR